MKLFRSPPFVENCDGDNPPNIDWSLHLEQSHVVEDVPGTMGGNSPGNLPCDGNITTRLGPDGSGYLL